MCIIKSISLSSSFSGQNYLPYYLKHTLGDFFRLREPIYIYLFYVCGIFSSNNRDGLCLNYSKASHEQSHCNCLHSCGFMS